jgi:hypothetical protein
MQHTRARYHHRCRADVDGHDYGPLTLNIQSERKGAWSFVGTTFHTKYGYTRNTDNSRVRYKPKILPHTRHSPSRAAALHTQMQSKNKQCSTIHKYNRSSTSISALGTAQQVASLQQQMIDMEPGLWTTAQQDRE